MPGPPLPAPPLPFGGYSDGILKDRHGEYASGLAELATVRPLRFSYREDNPLALDSGRSHVGVVAQDIEQAFPEAVHVGADGYRRVDYAPLFMATINAVNELKAENDRLRQRVKQLERQADRQR